MRPRSANFSLHWSGSSRFSLLQCDCHWRLLPTSELRRYMATSNTVIKAASVIGWIVLALLAGFFAAGWLALHIAHVPPQPNLTFAMFWAHWLVSVGACVPAILWSLYSNRRRFWLGLVFALFAIMSSCWGLSCIRIISTSETNGRVRCVFDSRWYFTASMVLATLAFAFVLVKRWRFRHVA